MITTMVLFWVAIVTAIIAVTLISLMRLKGPTNDSRDHWQPSRAYDWDAKD
jgi:hypothetical protein